MPGWLVKATLPWGATQLPPISWLACVSVPTTQRLSDTSSAMVMRVHTAPAAFTGCRDTGAVRDYMPRGYFDGPDAVAVLALRRCPHDPDAVSRMPCRGCGTGRGVLALDRGYNILTDTLILPRRLAIAGLRDAECAWGLTLALDGLLPPLCSRLASARLDPQAGAGGNPAQ